MSIKDITERAREAAGEAAEKAKGAAGEAAAKAKQTAGGVAEKAGGIAGTVRHKVGDAAEAVVGKVDDLSGGRVPTAVKSAVDKIDGEVDRAAGDEGTEAPGETASDTDSEGETGDA